MSAALVVSPATEAHVGQSVAISGTGFGTTDVITITITTPEQSEDVTWTTTAVAGGWSLPGTFEPDVDGLYTITATDESANTKTTTLKVFAG